jgi:membrane protein DedA with SNARE-associated domain
MTETMVAFLAHFIIATISATGYAGVALLMAIESACIPLPSEIIMPFAGYLVHTGQLKLLGVAIAGAIGCNLGSVVAYWIGALGGRPFITKYGRFVLLNLHDLDRAEHFFNKYGGITVFIGRLLPIVRTFIALPAGIAKMPQLRFHIYTFVGSLPWCYALAYVGARLGNAWETDPRFKATYHHYHLVMEALILIGLVWFVWTHWKNRVRPEEA